MHDSEQIESCCQLIHNPVSDLYRLDSGGGVLLDAGEGAWGALVRMYGSKAAIQQVWTCTKN